ncbi:MAG: hypothetical protein HYU88_10145 [Chloroflexi bacterium]|nr:hypothetical protein [Chloroflexota bacterium]MBI4507192.1 hypothetical protein [Chloroflexota bacterium]
MSGRAKLRGYLALGAAVLFCPCHLPLLLLLLAGTTAGALVGEHLLVAVVLAGAAFAAALWYGLRQLAPAAATEDGGEAARGLADGREVHG